MECKSDRVIDGASGGDALACFQETESCKDKKVIILSVIVYSYCACHTDCVA